MTIPGRFSHRGVCASIALTVAAICFALYAPAFAQVHDGGIDRIIASVDGDPITMGDLRIFSKKNGIPLPNPGQSDPHNVLRNALKTLIAKKMMDQELKHYAEKTDDAAVDRYLARIQEKGHLTDKAFRKELLKEGISYEDFRKRARIQLQQRAMIDKEVKKKIVIGENQIETYYNSHKKEFMVAKERLKLAQILIATDPKMSPAEINQAKAKAEELRKRALAGEDFNGLAKQYSDDESKSQGGELGDFAPSEIMDQIKDEVIKLNSGQLTPVIKTDFGFHIIKVEEHDRVGVKPLSEVKEFIEQRLTAVAFQAELRKWLENDLKKNHHVEIFL